MAIKKSDLYSSLWASCDELRGGMDASQYKDYVLFMLFIKYVSDKYGDSDDFAPPVTIPKGASFKDMIALKGKSDIGDKINTQIIQPLIDANSRLARSDFPDFNDPNKLGEGQAMVDRLTNLMAPSWQGKSSRRVAGRCSHVFGLLVRHTKRWPIMPCADQVPVNSPHSTMHRSCSPAARSISLTGSSWMRDAGMRLLKGWRDA
jgi:HsdM N-terminal domain